MRRTSAGTKRLARVVRVLAWLVIAALALFVSANREIVWEKGIELFLRGSKVNLEDVSTDVIGGIAAHGFSYSARLPSGAPIAIKGRDVFLTYNLRPRRLVMIGMTSCDIETRIMPAPAAEGRVFPLLKLLGRLCIGCPRTRLRVRWKDIDVSSDESRLVIDGVYGEEGLLFWQFPRVEISKSDNRIAVLKDMVILDSFKGGAAADIVPLLKGNINTVSKRVEIDMENICRSAKPSKARATGKFAGRASVSLEGGRFTGADVKLSSESGGSISIARDFIDDYLARGIPSPRREVMGKALESLQDYTFDSGLIRAQLVGDTIVVSVELEGEEGVRSLSFNLHDFLWKGKIVGNPFAPKGRETR